MRCSRVILDLKSIAAAAAVDVYPRLRIFRVEHDLGDVERTPHCLVHRPAVFLSQPFEPIHVL